jgi:hypothetical protein
LMSTAFCSIRYSSNWARSLQCSRGYPLVPI